MMVVFPEKKKNTLFTSRFFKEGNDNQCSLEPCTNLDVQELYRRRQEVVI